MKIDIRLLPLFQAIARNMSFSAAAEELGHSQPRVSILLKRLETQLGFQLFERTSRSVALTDSGAELLRALEPLDRAIITVERVIDEQRRRKRPQAVLRFGAPHFTRDAPARVALLDQVVATGIAEVDVRNDFTEPLLRGLRSGQLDVVIATTPFDRSGLETLTLSQSVPMLLVPQESDLAQLGVATPADLRGKGLVVLPPRIGEHYMNAWYKEFRDAEAELVYASEAIGSALVHTAELKRLSTIVHIFDDEPTVPAEMCLVPLKTAGFVGVEICLVRLAGPASRHIERLWALAQDIVLRLGDPAGRWRIG